jgi:hypothetical protein
MLEAGDRLGLAQEPLGHGRRRRELNVKDLHGDVTVQAGFADPKNGREAPLTQQRANGKFRTKRLLQALLEGFEVHGGAKS